MYSFVCYAYSMPFYYKNVPTQDGFEKHKIFKTFVSNYNEHELFIKKIQ